MIQQIQAEIRVIRDYDYRKLKKSERTRYSNRLKYLMTLLRFLEQGPSIDFIKKELERVENKIIAVELRGVTKETMEKLYQYSHLKLQRRALRQIVNGLSKSASIQK